MVHILHPKVDSGFIGRYQLGRGQECDIKISDISVSRNHCQIHYKNGKFRLQDTLSKFGTLTLVQGMLEILPETTTGVQIGRTMIIFQTRGSSLKECEVGDYLK